MLPVLPISASGNTQYEVTRASLLWAMAAALDLHRDVALPVPLHKGLAPSVLPSALASAYAVFAKFSAGDFCKKLADIRYNFFIKVPTVGFHICPYEQLCFCSPLHAKSCDIFICHSLKKFSSSFQFLQSNSFSFPHLRA